MRKVEKVDTVVLWCVEVLRLKERQGLRQRCKTATEEAVLGLAVRCRGASAKTPSGNANVAGKGVRGTIAERDKERQASAFDRPTQIAILQLRH